jgi:hypothetical protein
MIQYVTFKIFPNHPRRFKNWYYKVYIFSRKKSMYEVRDDLVKDGANIMKKPHKYEAVCSSFNSKKDKKQWGVVMFYLKSAARSGVVSHEMTHATTYWWKYLAPKKHKNIYKDGIADEMFARIQGNLVYQYWKTWYKVVKKK